MRAYNWVKDTKRDFYKRYVSMVKTITAVQQECKIERAKITQKVSSDKDENNKSYNP